ncbi:hypothetical protein QBC46DRAFT_411725 [Diplogelasinospora grovesii]|uniref:AA1-like domain-containing protein n=1 Tax=Diplogelasinospora grovesii TaxID=303347 RepID=A0AAN6S0M7_9PEZI|nr:hypothetical protein QBC46DRAFT_411725 [Diplogelasinospora grovesii]
MGTSVPRFEFILLLFALATAASQPCTYAPLRSPSWTISDWSAVTTAQDPASGGSVIFRLKNMATNYSALCFRRGALSQCFGADAADTTDSSTETYFSFHDESSRLDINQLWTCSDIDQADPYAPQTPSPLALLSWPC